MARARRTSPGLLAVGAASVAVFFAVGGDVHPLAAKEVVEPAVEDVPVCCVELVATAPGFGLPTHTGGGESMSAAPVVPPAASRWRVIDTHAERVLPAGDAPESGLQVQTVLTSRAISALFPEIQSIGGVRPDSLRWHPGGLALDVMIPHYSGAEGIALGDEIVAFVMKHAARLGIQDAIWRGVYYTPGGGARSGGYGHYDHVHVTTTGGGYPTGDEVYQR
jgi:hypothetical protein